MAVEFETYHVCGTCKMKLPSDCFHRCKGVKRGLQYNCKSCRREYSASTHQKQYHRNQGLKYSYGISAEEYGSMLKIQGGRCKICGCEKNTRVDREMALAVDHDHKTGKVRGLLCDKCNRGLGFFRDNPALLLQAISYLEGHHDTGGN